MATGKTVKKSVAKKTVAKPKKAVAKVKAKKVAAESVVRGPALIAAIQAALVGKGSPIGDPAPLDAKAILAAEKAAGVALSPSMFALLSFDAGWIDRQHDWFIHQKLRAAPTIEVIGEHAGVFAEMYEAACARLFPGKALGLDQGSDSMRLLYLGDPDELGEYPVLFSDHDDLPMIGVEHAGFDVWLAQELGIEVEDAEDALARTQARIFGKREIWDAAHEKELAKLPKPVAGPAPGSVVREVAAAPPAKKKRLTDAQLGKALSERAESGDLARLTELLADAEERGLAQKHLDAALVEAAKGRDLAVLEAMLAAGASPKARDHYGCALARACTYHGQVDIAKRLLDAGADPNGPSVNGQTALFEAVEKGSLELVKLLLEAGGDPRRAATNGSTVLHEAAAEGKDPAMIDLLLDHGAETEGGKGNWTALYRAIDAGRGENALRLLARGADPNARSRHLSATSLHAAFEKGLDGLAGPLIRAGAQRDARDDRGISLEQVYGPAGEDVRALDIHFAPSEGPQKVEVEVRVAVLNHHHMASFRHRPFSAGRWAALASGGLAGGDRFDPASGAGRVLSEADFTDIKKPGFHTRRFALELSAVGPDFIAFMVDRMLGGAFAFTGAGFHANVRTVGLTLRGAHEGPGAIGAAEVRAWMNAPRAPSAFPGPLPFAFDVVEGPAGVRVKSHDAPTTFGKTLERRVDAWLDLSSTWPRTDDGKGRPFFMTSVVPKPKPGWFGVSLEQPGEERELRRSFPFAWEAAAASLGNALRALHAETAIEAVELSIPSP